MNYYPFHIGDYIAHTRHLSPMEDLAYRRLLDAYYLAERPLNGCSTTLARRVGLSDHADAVEAVLREFFERDDASDSWVSRRADEEIRAYNKKRKQCSDAGVASVKARGGTRAERTLNDRSTAPGTDVEPTRTRTRTSTTARVARPDGVSESVWDDFLKLRKAKKAPLTEAAWKAILGEIAKAGWLVAPAIEECLVRGWAGFKAAWVDPTRNGKPAKRVTGNLDAEGRRVEHPQGMPVPYESKTDGAKCLCEACVKHRNNRGGNGPTAAEPKGQSTNTTRN